MNGRVSRYRLVAACVLAVVLAVPFVASGAKTASAATVRITNRSASPAYVSRFVAPKRVRVKYRLSAPAYVTITVSNSSGFTKRLVNRRYLSAGYKYAYWDLKRYTGAYAGNGRYTISISVRDRAGKAGYPNPARVYTYVDNTLPTGYPTAVSQTSISPSVGEAATITYRLSDNVTTTRLRATLEVVNTAGSCVRRIVQTRVIQGLGRVFVWDGRTYTGEKAPPGAYWARIVIQDLAGNRRISTESLISQLHVNAWGRDRVLDTTAYYDVVTRSDTAGDFTHVVWNDSSATGDKIRYRRLDKYGNTAVASIVVSSAILDSNHTRGVPDVSADASGGAYIVWRGRGRSTSRRGICLARIEPTGKVAWTKMVLSENNSYGILEPRVCVTPNGLAHVVCWKEGSPNAIYYATFRPDRNEFIGWASLATGSTGGARKSPNIVADRLGRVHIVWYDSIDHSPNVGRRELYYTRLAYANGLVTDPSPTGTVDRKRLTATTYGYSPSYDAPELAIDGGNSLHIAWPDQESAKASNGIRYMKVASNGTIAVTSRRVLDGSNTSTRVRYGRYQTIAASPDGKAYLVAAAHHGLTGPYRLHQVNLSSAGAKGKPFTITNGRADDRYPSLGSDSDGAIHLVYAADTNAPVYGSTQRRLSYKDIVIEPAANDRTRADLEIDSAHVVHSSVPSPPRQNTPVTVQAEIRNAGWVPILGGTATLEFEGAPVATVPIPTLMVESTATVSLPWTVPDDATRTPAALVVRVAPTGDTTQTASTNDTAAAPVWFVIPPTGTDVLVSAYDETRDENHTLAGPVYDATVTLSGTTAEGASFVMTGTPDRSWNQFLNVPPGTYTMTHSKAGFLPSAPLTQVVNVVRDPADRYKISVTPGNLMGVLFNRWGSIEGVAHESDGTTPVAGVKVTLLESGATSTTPSGGGYRFGRICEGTYRLKAAKTGYKRTYLDAVVLPAQVLDLDIPMSVTTTGYAVGSILDESGGPAINDPEDASDDPTLVIKTSAGILKYTLHPHDGTFNVELPAGSYKFSFSAPGYKPRNDVAVTIEAGEETDATNELVLNVLNMQHKTAPERWVAPWTINANWFGSQPPGSEIPSYNIKKWNGLFRFWFNGDYQHVGLNDYVRYVNLKIIGEVWEWHYLFGVTPPTAPKVFRYEQDLLGLYDDRFEPPILADGGTWNRTGVRVDGVDIVDQRTWETVSSIRSQWNSCDEQKGHLYGSMTDGAQGDGPFPAYTHAVPWNQQVVRVWLNVGRMDVDGNYYSDSFDVSDLFNRGQLMQGGGCNKLALYWRPTDNYLWVEPALTGYPQ